MKKTLAALAVLGAFAGSALAAEVQLYGILDTGVGYSHIDIDKPDVNDVDSLEMKSGVGSGSRWGLKGTEELGNGLTVSRVCSCRAISARSLWVAWEPSTAANPRGQRLA